MSRFKVLGNVFEAILAVIFIDSGFDLDTVFAVLDKIYEDIMPFVATETERRASLSDLYLLGYLLLILCEQFRTLTLVY